MATPFASMAVKWALDKLSSLMVPERIIPVAFSSSSSISQGMKDLRVLERTMQRIHATLVDAEEHWNIHEESAKLRLRELKELAYGAQDVVEEYEYEVNRCRPEDPDRYACNGSKRKRHQVNGEHLSEVGLVPVSNELATKARELIQRFDEMKVYYKYFSISDNDGERRTAPGIECVRPTSYFVVKESIVGRESDREKVIEKLMFGEGSNVASHLSVLAIVGMGGLGKTTLAQLVYNDQTMCQSFDVRAWVYVSDHFEPKSLMEKISVSIEELSNELSSPKENSKELSELVDPRNKLVKKIKGKRIFLVLDDVWNERMDCWEAFQDPMLAAQQCKILVTTRNLPVARLVQTMPHYSMNHLSPQESWTLFKRTVTTPENAIQGNLVDIAKKIVEKCDRLPLAIKTLGSMLRYETHESRWIDILESDLWDLDKAQSEVLPALKLSYKNMPVHLKQCFLALCLFPKGRLRGKSEVIWLWKLLDMLKDDERNDGDKNGNRYFDELVQRSFLQLFSGSCIMHDLIHDLACHLSGNEFFRLEGDKPVQIPENTRFMSIHNCDTSVQFSVTSHPLWAIIVFGVKNYSRVNNPEHFFLYCKNLRVLSLSYSNIGKALPRYISGLKLLRRLELPLDGDYLKLICNLGPTDRVDYLKELECAPNGIGNLINLHTLRDIRIRRCGCRFNLSELKNLNKLRELRIRGLGNLSHTEDANEVQLVSKKHLHLLELNFSDEKECQKEQCQQLLQQYEKVSHEQLELDFTFEEGFKKFRYQSVQQLEYVTVSHNEILESLRPHEGLINLIIEDYDCQSYPNWLGNASFSRLTVLVISARRKWVRQQRVPTLGELPALKSLKISSMYYLEHIGREFCSHAPGIKGFPSLTSLEFSYIPWWNEWTGVDYGDFPFMETLSLRTVYKLRALPLDRFPSLGTLTLDECDGIDTIPAGGTIKKLCIGGCYGLYTLPTQSSLLKLQLKDCPRLSVVSSMPELDTLEIFKCPKLTAVGFMPKLQTSKIQHCRNLITIDSMHD
ncbi:putative disease resistance RPP13-like protein 1 [Oryza glaberrima]|nr:putative disease resistance RPP13-like protein 1 [Oryza glaberrima]